MKDRLLGVETTKGSKPAHILKIPNQRRTHRIDIEEDGLSRRIFR